MPTETHQTEEAPVTLSDRRALVERLARSAELRRAARLRTFLLYVSDQTLSHGATVIHEQEIGTAVFGRPPNYDTSIDNIVRVNATELRKRLEHYFAEEGSNEEIVLEIQRGNYIPIFRRRLPGPSPTPRLPHAEPPASAVPPSHETAALIEDPSSPSALPRLQEAPPAPMEPSPLRAAIRPVWSQGAALLLLALCGYLAWQLHAVANTVQPWRRDPSLHLFWQNFFAAGSPTSVLLADTSFAIAEDMMRRPVSLPDYLDYNYKRFAEDPSLSEEHRRDLWLVLERNTGSIADFRVAQQILSLDPSDPTHVALKFAREFAPGEAKHNNLILIGSTQSNPWVSLFAGKLNFDLTYDTVQSRPLIVNRAPHPGESPAYPESRSGDTTGIGYAVIAFVPGLSENGNALIIEGTDSQATGAAGDYLTTPESMHILESKFPAGRIPYFEALLRTSQLNGTPLRGEVIALRTYGSH